MNILKKLMTAVRGGAREAGEAIIDANAIRILEQEIVDAKKNLEKGRVSLTEVMAKEMQTKRQISAIQTNISEHEGFAKEALEKNNETLALEIARKISEYESALSDQQAILSGFTGHIATLKSQIKQAEKTIAENERQLLMVKTTESVQKATMSVTDNIAANNSTMRSARESLERIKKKQQDRADQIAAGEALQAELSDDLAAKMKASGIGPQESSAESILERLRQQ
ncbi:MAG: PspA/IM30 family protein [Chromatiales bacterium]|nr:PspA/IM30 family protein [Chromatiales bacterium]